MHNSSEHMHGAQIPVTSLHFVGVVGGKDSIASSRDEIEAPASKNKNELI